MESIKYAIAKQELVQEKFDEKKIMYFLSKIPKGDRCPPVIKKKEAPLMVAPDKKTLKKSVKSMFFMVQTRCEVKTIKY